MRIRNLRAGDYERIIASDRLFYPTNTPVTPDAIGQWYGKHPEFGIAFEHADELSGLCAAIPLNEDGWRRLTSGEIAEAQLGEAALFKGGRDADLAIHIYHLEKLSGWTDPQPLYLECLSRLRDVVRALQQDGKSPRVVGFSGLCVTAQGIALFSDKLRCRERDFVCSEHILKMDGTLEVFRAASKQALLSKLGEGYEYVNRCQMLVSYPGEPSVVWQYLGLPSGSTPQRDA